MRKIKSQVLASTGVDRSGREISEVELEELFGQIPDPYIFNQGHDLSKPPGGKGLNKRLKRLNNGKLAIIMDIELFDDALEIDANGMSIAFGRRTSTKYKDRTADIKIRYNSKHIDKNSIEAIVNLSNDKLIINGIELEQKGLEEVLIVILEFMATGLALGILQRAGSDIYDKIKEKLLLAGKTHLAKSKNTIVYHFIYYYVSGENNIEILVKCSFDKIENINLHGIDLESLHKYLDLIVGKSKIIKAIVEHQDKSPFWRVIHIIDPEGKPIEL